MIAFETSDDGTTILEKRRVRMLRTRSIAALESTGRDRSMGMIDGMVTGTVSATLGLANVS